MLSFLYDVQVNIHLISTKLTISLSDAVTELISDSSYIFIKFLFFSNMILMIFLILNVLISCSQLIEILVESSIWAQASLLWILKIPWTYHNHHYLHNMFKRLIIYIWSSSSLISLFLFHVNSHAPCFACTLTYDTVVQQSRIFITKNHIKKRKTKRTRYVSFAITNDAHFP